MAYYDHDHTAKRQQDPCEYILYKRDGTPYACKAPWSSVLHRPNQYRHWCNICEMGGDHD